MDELFNYTSKHCSISLATPSTLAERHETLPLPEVVAALGLVDDNIFNVSSAAALVQKLFFDNYRASSDNPTCLRIFDYTNVVVLQCLQTGESLCGGVRALGRQASRARNT